MRPLALEPSRRAALTLAALFFTCGLAVLGLAMSGRADGVERTLLLALRQPGDLAAPIGPVWGLTLTRMFTHLGAHAALALMAAAVAAWLWRKGAADSALRLAVATAGSIILAGTLKLIVMRPRPEVTPHLASFAGASFPSSHAMLSMAVLLLIAITVPAPPRWRQRLCFIAVIISLLIGLTRPYLGVHWPTDVLGGWLLGAGWAALYAALLPAPRVQASARDATPPWPGGDGKAR